MKLKPYKKLIIVILALIIIIAGTVVKLTKGMNYGLKWKKNTLISMDIHDVQVNKNDLENIVKEAFSIKNYKIQNVGEEDNYFLITIDKQDITDEEKQAFIEKINTKYEIDLTIDDITVDKNNNVLLMDIIKPYIIPVLISVIIISAYFILRYKKIGGIKIAENLIYGIVLPQWVYFSILAIFRIPVYYFTMPISMLIYLISIMVLILIFEKECKSTAFSKNNKKGNKA